MNITPKGDQKVVVSQEYTVGVTSWPGFVVEMYVGAVVWSIILRRPEWVRWLISWLPGA